MGNAFRQKPAHQVQKTGAVLGREATEGDPIKLLLQTLDVVRVTMPDAADCDTGDEVEIFVSVNVCNGATVGVVYHDLRVEGDGLQPWRHGVRLVIEDRLRSRTRDRAAPAAILRRGRAVDRWGVVHWINSLLRRQGADAARSVRSNDRRSPSPPGHGTAHSWAMR